MNYTITTTLSSTQTYMYAAHHRGSFDQEQTQAIKMQIYAYTPDFNLGSPMISHDWARRLLGVTHALSEQCFWDDLLQSGYCHCCTPKPYILMLQNTYPNGPIYLPLTQTQWKHNLHLHFWNSKKNKTNLTSKPLGVPIGASGLLFECHWDSLHSTHLHQPHWKPWPVAGCRCLGGGHGSPRSQSQTTTEKTLHVFPQSTAGELRKTTSFPNIGGQQLVRVLKDVVELTSFPSQLAALVRHGCHLLVIKTLPIDSVRKYLSIDKIRLIGWYT